jgi:hypothetical protein
MCEQGKHAQEDVVVAAQGIRGCPGGTDPEALEGVLLLGAVALELEAAMPSAAKWVASNQDRLLADHAAEIGFPELVKRAREVALGMLWLEEFFSAVGPDDADPWATYLIAIAPLEQLSMVGTMPAAFVAHAFLETKPSERLRLLTALAEKT